jgi:hypothetical protein
MTIHELLLTRPAAPPLTAARSGLRGARFNAQELLATLVGLRSRARNADAPRARIRMSVYFPDGRPAVDVRLGPDPV